MLTKENIEEQERIDNRILGVVRTVNAHLIKDFGSLDSERSIIEDLHSSIEESKTLNKSIATLEQLKSILVSQLKKIELIEKEFLNSFRNDTSKIKLFESKYKTLYSDIVLLTNLLKEYIAAINNISKTINDKIPEDKKLKIISHEYAVGEEEYNKIFSTEQNLIAALEVIKQSLSWTKNETFRFWLFSSRYIYS